MTNQKGFTLWLTGLSGSGKTTIANRLNQRLKDFGFLNIEILDGDSVRQDLSKDLGFSRQDRITNMKRVGFVCNLLTRNNVVVITALISPFREIRDEIRKNGKNFVEVYVKCSFKECERRDTKNMYSRARLGQLTNFTGIDSPYEPPSNPEVICETEHESEDQSVNKIIQKLKTLKYIPVKSET
tara:strand:+ start:78 stop:629 length:552 start_codon:yes stop_codon:yes gene_type:complete